MVVVCFLSFKYFMLFIYLYYKIGLLTSIWVVFNRLISITLSTGPYVWNPLWYSYYLLFYIFKGYSCVFFSVLFKDISMHISRIFLIVRVTSLKEMLFKDDFIMLEESKLEYKNSNNIYNKLRRPRMCLLIFITCIALPYHLKIIACRLVEMTFWLFLGFRFDL